MKEHRTRSSNHPAVVAYHEALESVRIEAEKRQKRIHERIHRSKTRIATEAPPPKHEGKPP